MTHIITLFEIVYSLYIFTTLSDNKLRRMINLSIIFIRAFILYVVVIVTMRIMGKRQIGQLQPFELAIAIMISELAAVPMQNRGIPLLSGIVPISALLIAQVLFSYINMKSLKARKVICGKPTILVENGYINESMLQDEMYTLNDLMEQLRIKDYPNIADIEYAILETNGQLSVVPKPSKRAVNTSDLNIKAKYEGLPVDLVIDGVILTHNLKKLNVDIEWLRNLLNKHGIYNARDLLYASFSSDGNLFYQSKRRRNGI